MKRLFFSLLAVCSFAIASAQPVSDASVITARLQLDNVIMLIPPTDFVEAHFSDAVDYLNPSGLVLEDISGNDSTPFLVYSNRNFNVAIKSATPMFSYVGTGTGNSVMPCSVLEYNLSSNGTGGTNSTPSLWNVLSVTSAPVITGGTSGAARPFALRLRAKPGWSYTAGAYTLGVIVTATQL